MFWAIDPASASSKQTSRPGPRPSIPASGARTVTELRIYGKIDAAFKGNTIRTKNALWSTSLSDE